jgi:hypothetical protein
MRGEKVVAFSYRDESGFFRHFNVTGILREIEQIISRPDHPEITVIDIKPDHNFGRYILTNRGIEPHRIKKIMQNPKEVLEFPLVAVLMPDLREDGTMDPDPWSRKGSHLIIDGHHRYVVACHLNVDFIPIFVLQPEFWERFLIHGIPDDYSEQCLNRHSGIY